MPGINTTGLPNTDDYNLGRGIVYFAPLDATTQMPLSYRDLGNAPEFSISVESETLEHQSSRRGLKVTDKEVVISQKITLSLTLDEINFGNLALLLSGSTAAHTNAAVLGFTDYLAYTNVVLGRWYDVRAGGADGARAYGITTGDLTLEKSPSTPLLLNDDYLVDEEMGRFFLKSNAANILAGDNLDMALAAKPTAKPVDEVQALKTTAVLGALKFVGENPASSDQQTEYQFHKVSLKAEGDFSLIGDEFSQMQFTAVAEANATADPNSGTLTIRLLKD